MPFSGLVRFMGALMRLGLYTFMMALLPRGHSVPALFARSGSPSMLTTTPSFIVATKLQLPQSMHMRQCPYTSPCSPASAALAGTSANACTGLLTSAPARAAPAAKAPAPLMKPRRDSVVGIFALFVLTFISFALVSDTFVPIAFAFVFLFRDGRLMAAPPGLSSPFYVLTAPTPPPFSMAFQNT